MENVIIIGTGCAELPVAVYAEKLDGRIPRSMTVPRGLQQKVGN
jgi:hypothetical protein